MFSDPIRSAGRAISQLLRPPEPKPQPKPEQAKPPETNPALARYHRDSFEAAPAGAQAARFNPDNPQDVQQLAQRYAPVRYLHPDEQYGPADPNQFIQNSRLREQKDLWPDSTRDGFDTGEIDPASLPDQEGDNLFLDLEDSEEARAGTPNAPSFYQYDKETNSMTYWQFYNYNKAPGPGNLNHEGDWERVTVQFDDKMKPTEVRYSAHDGNTVVPWNEAPKENGRPVAYTGLGSHANSPTTGSGDTGVFFVKDDFQKGQRIDTAQQPLLNVQEQPWYDTDVHWGQAGVFEFTSGPGGPGYDKGPLT